ncbi:MAG TPA: hypothetical protein VES65_11425 [Solirubrobacteraceae bacterium]|nr:hypothetical protein [Solirubrobacteraceae bacterium]
MKYLLVGLVVLGAGGAIAYVLYERHQQQLALASGVKPGIAPSGTFSKICKPVATAAGAAAASAYGAPPAATAGVAPAAAGVGCSILQGAANLAGKIVGAPIASPKGAVLTNLAVATGGTSILVAKAVPAVSTVAKTAGSVIKDVSPAALFSGQSSAADRCAAAQKIGGGLGKVFAPPGCIV